MEIKLIVISLFAFAISCKSQLTRWESSKTIANVEFEKVRYKILNHDTIMIIGLLNKETVIENFPCAKDYVYFNNECKIQNFRLAKPFFIGTTEIPANTWVSLERYGYYVCSLPEESTFDVYTCMKGNGKDGPVTVFYSNGALRSFFSPEDIKIGEIYCAGGKSNEIGFLKNGSLEYCTISIDHNINDVKYKRGSVILFDLNGNVSAVKEK